MPFFDQSFMILPTDFVLFTDAILENGAQRVLGKTLQVWSSGFPLSNKMASKKRKRDPSKGMNIHAFMFWIQELIINIISVYGLIRVFLCLILVAVFRGKYLLENAGNGISKPLDFKIFWGGHAPQTPREPHTSGARFHSCLLFVNSLLLKVNVNPKIPTFFGPTVEKCLLR